MFGFLKRLKFRSGYSYTTAAARSVRRSGGSAVRSAKDSFAEGVELGRMLERAEKRVVRKGKKWRGR